MKTKIEKCQAAVNAADANFKSALAAMKADDASTSVDRFNTHNFLIGKAFTACAAAEWRLRNAYKNERLKNTVIA